MPTKTPKRPKTPLEKPMLKGPRKYEARDFDMSGEPEAQGGSTPKQPPKQPPSPPGDENLQQFMNCVQWLLDKITGDWKEMLIKQDRREVMRAAYDDLVKREVFKTCSDELARAKQPSLLAAGLSGAQLKPKLSKFKELWDKFITWGGVGWLARVLTLANKILCSFIKVVPAGEAVKELKDMCEEEMIDAADEVGKVAVAHRSL